MTTTERTLPTMPTIDDAILAGDYDQDLGAIAEAVRQRRKAVGQVTFATLSVGDKVRLTQAARPAYLRGATATIVAKRQSKVTIVLDDPAGRFGTRPIVTPVELLEAV